MRNSKTSVSNMGLRLNSELLKKWWWTEWLTRETPSTSQRKQSWRSRLLRTDMICFVSRESLRLSKPTWDSDKLSELRLRTASQQSSSCRFTSSQRHKRLDHALWLASCATLSLRFHLTTHLSTYKTNYIRIFAAEEHWHQWAPMILTKFRDLSPMKPCHRKISFSRP